MTKAGGSILGPEGQDFAAQDGDVDDFRSPSRTL